MQLASCLLIFFIANIVELSNYVNTSEVALRRHERDMKLDPNQKGLYIDYGYSESPIGSLPPQVSKVFIFINLHVNNITIKF